MRDCSAERLELQLLVLLALSARYTLNDGLELFLVKIGLGIDCHVVFFVHLVPILIIHSVLLHVCTIVALDVHLVARAFDNALLLLVRFVTVVSAIHVGVQLGLVARCCIVLRIRLVQTVFVHLFLSCVKGVKFQSNYLKLTQKQRY